ncbi:MAG: hypothetical protein ACXABD_03805 [Candidatus Thorarchaeota archaeon]
MDLLVPQFLVLDLQDLTAAHLQLGVAVVVELLVVQGLPRLRVEDEHAQGLHVGLADLKIIHPDDTFIRNVSISFNTNEV